MEQGCFAWACATAEQAMCMEAHHRVCLHQNGAPQRYHSDYFARWSWRMCWWFNKMCSLQKTLTWSYQKRSRPALTYTSYYQISSPHLTWTTARVYVVLKCSAWRIALTSSKCKQSAETFVDASKHFQFSLFWNGKGREILKRKHSKFQRVGSKCAKADVRFSSELIYVVQFSQHFKATKLRAHET